jgi:hypothetical protein
MAVSDSILKVPLRLREKPLFKKFAEMLDFEIEVSDDEFKDIKFKFRDSEELSDEIVLEIVKEQGFEYISDLILTLQNINTSNILNFVSLLHLLKGHRDGLELVLTLLGFEFEIREWWEQSPQAEPHTFDDVFLTLNRIRTFAENYVYPKFAIANLIVDFEFAEATAVVAGFNLFECSTEIVGSL